MRCRFLRGGVVVRRADASRNGQRLERNALAGLNLARTARLRALVSRSLAAIPLQGAAALASDDEDVARAASTGFFVTSSSHAQPCKRGVGVTFSLPGGRRKMTCVLLQATLVER